MLTLGLTTSTGAMAVAVGRGADVVAERRELTDRQHAERLLPLIHEALDQAGQRLRDVERLAVDVGPGLFTGLRVGLATVGGLARALEVPVVTASSLFLVAAGSGLDGDLLAVIDARRGEVFAQPFRVSGTSVTALAPPRLLAPAELDVAAGRPLVGDGAVRYRDQVPLGGDVRPADPCAVELVRRAEDLPVSPHRVPAPCYLRAPDARIGAWTTREGR